MQRISPGLTLAAPLPAIASASREKPMLLCFSHLRWDFVFQRPQHLLTRAARQFRVFYVEEPVFHHSTCTHLRLSTRNDGVTVCVPHLPSGLTEAENQLLQEELITNLVAKERRGTLVTWYYTPMALSYSRRLACDLCVYDCMDELSGFLGAPRELAQLERELFAKAQLVMTGGYALYEAKRAQHHNIHPFPSSVDVAHFGRARSASGADPDDQAAINHPRIGFFGVIDERLDHHLLAEMADLQPGWQFVMLGPVVKIDPASLPQRSNIHWLGGKAYSELPRYLAGWDAGIMPFAHNAATRFISPTKTPEFLAAGVPVVSTAIRDVVRPYGEQGLVEIAEDAAGFVEALERLLHLNRDSWFGPVDRFLAGNSWDQTWRRLNGLMRSLLDEQMAEETPLAAKTLHAIRSNANV